MPFTLCHPAIVLPLHARARRLTSLPALVIGSMAPDFVYFLPLAANGGFTHSLPGILLYCLPAGLLVYVIYHALLREAFIDWAPAAISRRMPAGASWMVRDIRAVGLVLGSLVIGAATHIAWDAFTHANTVVVRQVDVLRWPITIGAYAVPPFKLLQHLSSLVGLIVILAYARRWLITTAPGPLPGRPLSARQSLSVLAAVVIAAAGGGLAGWLSRPARTEGHVLFNAVVTAMAAAALAVLLFGLGRKIAGLRA